MGVRRAVGGAASFVLIVGLVLVAQAAPASACSCASVDPVDAVGYADVVFTGTVVANEGDDREPVWLFQADGVVKGQVEERQVVIGEDWGGGCGTDFSRFAGPIVVYARQDGDALRAMGCMPAPTATDFAELIADVPAPSGTGPPAAVVVGIVGTSDIAVLDGDGRAIARGVTGLGGGATAHCAGTSIVAVVQTSPGRVSLVDLRSFEVVSERPVNVDGVYPGTGQVACLDGGDVVLATGDYGPNNGSITVGTSLAGAPPLLRSFDDFSRAIFHPSGSVYLLPNAVGSALETRSPEDLELVAETLLPEAAATLDGAVSPDGMSLALLVNLSGGLVEWDTGATHVMVLDVVDGVPRADTVVTVPLPTAGERVETPAGAAKWIEWIDDRAWAVEFETVSSKRIALVSVDGAELVAPIDVGWGWGLARIPAGVLRAYNGGVQVLDPDGLVTAGDPPPAEGYVDRGLSVAALRDAPEFSPTPDDGPPRLEIRPLDVAVAQQPLKSTESSDPTPTPDDAEPMAIDDGAPVEQAVVAEPASPRSAGRSVWPWVVGAIVVGSVALGVVAGRRRGFTST